MVIPKSETSRSLNGTFKSSLGLCLEFPRIMIRRNKLAKISNKKLNFTTFGTLGKLVKNEKKNLTSNSTCHEND